MIDLKQEIRTYNIIDLKDISSNEAEIPDNIRNSVFLYNKAIESLRTGSEDIAIIELKKAVSMNPRFYEAMNLLGLCYSYIKDYSHASEVFDRVIKAENNSVKALRYMSLLNSGDMDGALKTARKKKPDPPRTREPAKKSAAAVTEKKYAKYVVWLTCAAFFIAGVLLALLIQNTLLKPREVEKEPIENNVTDAGIVTDDYKMKYEKLQSDHDFIKSELDAADKEIDYQKAIIKLFEIESLAAKKQWEEAADLLLRMQAVEYEGEYGTRFEDLRTNVLPNAAKTVYDQGYKLYNTKKYEDALKKLIKVETYNPGFNRMDAALYYMGRCYQLMNDSRNAVAVFQRLVDSFPKSSYAANAKVRINSLTKQP